MFILPLISSGLKSWFINHTSVYENSELKVFKNIKFVGSISHFWRSDLLGKNVFNALEPNW